MPTALDLYSLYLFVNLVLILIHTYYEMISKDVKIDLTKKFNIMK